MESPFLLFSGFSIKESFVASAGTTKSGTFTVACSARPGLGFFSVYKSQKKTG
jgi:hypothetical protein